MDIVKKNLFSIVCGVIALLAIVAVFIYPLDGFFKDLNDKAKKSAGKFATINGMLKKTRAIPNPNPRNPNSTESLAQFPSNEVIAVGESEREKIDAQSKFIYWAAVDKNERKLPAVPGTLPKPASDHLLLNFRKLLKEKLDDLRVDKLGGGIPPTPEEITRRKTELWENQYKDKVRYVNGEATNMDRVKADFDREAAKLPDVMQAEFAKRYKLYVDPYQTMMVPKEVPEATAPTMAVMWWAQVEYWVTEDVVAAISAMNAKSTGVEDSPVKQLRSLVVPQSFFPPPGANGTAAAPTPDAAAGGDNPAAAGVEPDPTVALPDGSSQSPTKRVSNPLYDVVHFNLQVDIEANAVPAFLRQLATNRFLTVLNMEMTTVDPQLVQINRYVYGPRPVVTLTLECEEIFMRYWTINLMPDTIRDLVGAPRQYTPKQLTSPTTRPAAPGAAPKTSTTSARD